MKIMLHEKKLKYIIMKRETESKNIHTSIYTYAYTHRGVTMKAELIEKKADLRRLSPELFESWVSFIDVKEGSIATYKRAIKRFSL